MSLKIVTSCISNDDGVSGRLIAGVILPMSLPLRMAKVQGGTTTPAISARAVEIVRPAGGGPHHLEEKGVADLSQFPRLPGVHRSPIRRFDISLASVTADRLYHLQFTIGDFHALHPFYFRERFGFTGAGIKSLSRQRGAEVAFNQTKGTVDIPLNETMPANDVYFYGSRDGVNAVAAELLNSSNAVIANQPSADISNDELTDYYFGSFNGQVALAAKKIRVWFEDNSTADSLAINVV